MGRMNFKPSADLTKRILASYPSSSKINYSRTDINESRSWYGNSLRGMVFALARRAVYTGKNEVKLGNSGTGFYEDVAKDVSHYLHLPSNANKLLWPLYCELENYLVKPIDEVYGVIGIERGIMAFRKLKKNDLFRTPKLPLLGKSKHKD